MSCKTPQFSRLNRPKEFHPRPLQEPDVNLSAHPAPIIQTARKYFLWFCYLQQLFLLNSWLIVAIGNFQAVLCIFGHLDAVNIEHSLRTIPHQTCTVPLFIGDECL